MENSFDIPVEKEGDKEKVFHALVGAAREAGLAERGIMSLAAAAAEPVTNILRHAGRGRMKVRAV